MANSELAIYYRKYKTAIWHRIDSYISGDFKPKVENSETSAFFKFTCSFNDAKDSDNALIDFRTGDDIAICTNSARTAIQDGICAGKITALTLNSKYWGAYDVNKKAIPFIISDLTIQNRDFSTIPFRLQIEGTIALNDLLSQVFQEYTRDDLGGLLSSGVIIPKFTNYSADENILNYDFWGTAKQHLTEILDRIGYSWKVLYFCEPNETNNLKLIQTIKIWEA